MFSHPQFCIPLDTELFDRIKFHTFEKFAIITFWIKPTKKYKILVRREMFWV